jgi:hypothetical protein
MESATLMSNGCTSWQRHRNQETLRTVPKQFERNLDNMYMLIMGYGLDDQGSRVRFPVGAGIFLYTTTSRTALGPTQPPIQWVPGALSLGIKQLGHEADHSPPSSAQVKNVWSYTSTPPVRLQGMVLS